MRNKLIWVKTDTHGKPFHNPGGIVRHCSEVCLIGAKGENRMRGDIHKVSELLYE